MKLLSSLAGGIAGAISVTILHGLIRKIDPSVPRPALPGQQRLMNAHKHLSGKHRLLMIGLSVAGGLIAAGVTKWLDGPTTKKPVIARTKAPDEAYKPVLDITV